MTYPRSPSYLEEWITSAARMDSVHESEQVASLIPGIAAALTNSGSSTELLQASVEVVARAVDATLVRVWTLDATREALSLQASAGRHALSSRPTCRVAVSEPWIEQLLNYRNSHLIGDLLCDTSYEVEEEAQADQASVAFSGHPLIARGQLLGILDVSVGQPLRDRVIAALRTVVDLIAFGIERYRAEDTIKASEERYQALLGIAEKKRGELEQILDSIPALIFIKDRQHRLIHVNQAHAESYGLPKEQIEGKTDLELGSPFAAKYIEDDLTVFNTGKPLRGLVEQFNMPQGTRWIETEKVPLRDVQGNIVGLVGIAMDITEKKQLEAQLRQSQKLDVIGQLAGGVAHDFNNLLTVINGYSEFLLEAIGPEGLQRPLVEEISKAGNRAARLTHQLLMFSRKQVLEPKNLQLNTLVGEMEKMLRRLIGEHVELRTVLDPQLGLIKADSGQLEQVIMNLAVNARDAMPNGGLLTITTELVTVAQKVPEALPEMSPGSYVRLTVSDTGCGIDAVTRSRLFEPFFTTKGPGKGTGLGLATVFGIMVQSSGHVLVDTEVGTGTSFHVYLPQVVAEVSRPAPATSTPSPFCGGHETVLLAEDDEDVREMAYRVLEQSGYHVLQASNGKAALQIIEDYPDVIHLLITDLVMPHLGGGELATKLAVGRKDTKVLFLSGYTASEVMEQGLVSTHVPLLEKPFTPKSLTSKAREVLNGTLAARKRQAIPAAIDPVATPLKT